MPPRLSPHDFGCRIPALPKSFRPRRYDAPPSRLVCFSILSRRPFLPCLVQLEFRGRFAGDFCRKHRRQYLYFAEGRAEPGRAVMTSRPCFDFSSTPVAIPAFLRLSAQMPPLIGTRRTQPLPTDHYGEPLREIASMAAAIYSSARLP